MVFTDYQTLLSLAGSVTVLGTAFITIRKIIKDFDRKNKEQANDILREAAELDTLLKAKLEAKIESLRVELKNLESNNSKDLDHLKETQTNELRVLGEKIELIRNQLNDQHSQLLSFLTRLVEKR